MSTTETQEQVKKPLTDEQVSDVSGGGVDSSIISAWRKIAEAEGRGAHIGAKEAGAFIHRWHNANCPKCGAVESLFGRSIVMTKEAANRLPLKHDCEDVKCYVCGYHFGNCHLVSGSLEVYIQDWGR